MNEEQPSLDRLARAAWAALIVGIIAIIVWIVGFATDGSPMHQQAMYSYLFAFVFWGSITIGAFAMMLLQGSLRASWGVAIIRIFEAAGGPLMLVVLFLLFLPLALPFGMHAVYSWSVPDVVQHDPIIQQKTWYLNPTGFWIRTIVIIVIWIIWSVLMKASTRRQDETLNENEWAFRSNLGSPGLLVFFITITFLATDWVMSVEPHYFSTAYPLIFAVGCGLSAMSIAVMVVLYNSDVLPYRAIVTPKLTKDFGNLLFTLTMLWGYLTLAQFLITWQGNLPMEASYYVSRTGGNILVGQGNWNVLSLLLLTCQFFIPFFALLAPRVKRVIPNLIWVSAFIFVTRIINVYWLVFPGVRGSLGESLGHWTDYVAFFGVGGIWFAIFALQLTKVPRLLPRFDTRLMEVEHA